MSDGALLSLGAVGALALGASVSRRGSRSTRFPFLFESFRKGNAYDSRRYWRLPPEVIEAASRRSGVPPSGELALVYENLVGGMPKRALGVMPLIEADNAWQTAFVVIDGERIFGEIKGLAALDAEGKTRHVNAFEVPDTRRRYHGMRRISDRMYGEGEGSSARTPIRKAFIAKGELLYHGTGVREDFTHPDAPAWFTQEGATAEWFTGWSDGPRPRVLSFRATRRIPNLLLMRSSAELAAVMEHLVPYDPPEDPTSMSEAVCDAGYAGWRIPGNYPDGGDDILICDDRVIESLEPIGVRRLPRAGK